MSLYKREGSPFWQYEFQVQKRKFRGSTKTDNKRIARTIEERERVKARESVARDPVAEQPTDADMTVSEVFGRYWLHHGNQTKWAKSAAGHIRQILASVDPNKLYREIGNADVSRFVTYRREVGRLYRTRADKDDEMDIQARRKAKRRRSKGGLVLTRHGDVSQATINRALHLWRAVHNMARDLWEIPVRPIKWGKHKGTEPQERVRSLSTDEVKRLVSHLPRDIALAAIFAVATGCRQNETFTLTWEHIDWTNRRCLVLAKSKIKGFRRNVELSAQALAVLAEMQAASPDAKPTDLVFSAKNRRKIFLKALKEAGISDFRWHDMRHVFATWMASTGATIQTVSKLLGHSSISVTMKYVGVFRDEMQHGVNRLPQIIDTNVLPIEKRKDVG